MQKERAAMDTGDLERQIMSVRCDTCNSSGACCCFVSLAVFTVVPAVLSPAGTLAVPLVSPH